ncbi:hypothetical protein [Sphingomonas sp.]|uniref:hypothetical protein n=1 Tax=Sphingomonas sp. TaxID=28214 RepID=UPI002DEA0CDD|nr:hypothetical protein [Sphingomonas sp.]
MESVERATKLAPAAAWNVVRIEEHVVGLLEYEEFDASAFPALLCSVRVDLLSGRVSRTDYSASRNPLILHRKELLVAPSDQRVRRWAEITAALENRGLFKDSNRIGRQRQWKERLKSAGLEIAGDKVCPA